jgi:hypothetical protein
MNMPVRTLLVTAPPVWLEALARCARFPRPKLAGRGRGRNCGTDT